MSPQTRTILIVLAVALGLTLATVSGAVAGGLAGYLIGSSQRPAIRSHLEQRLELVERQHRAHPAPSQPPAHPPFLRRFPAHGGALVIEVVPGSPAAQAGIRPGTIITEVDGTHVQASRSAGHHSLASLIRGHSPGDTVALTVRSQDGETRIAVALGETQDSEGDVIPWLGVRYRPISIHGLPHMPDWHPTDQPPASLF